MTDQDVRAQTEKLWDEEWGDIDEFGFTYDIEELDSYKIGDKVVVIVDEASDPSNPDMNSGYEGDIGIVVGFSAPREGGGPFNLPRVSYKLYVALEDMEPQMFDPADLDHNDARMDG